MSELSTKEPVQDALWNALRTVEAVERVASAMTQADRDEVGKYALALRRIALQIREVV